MLVDPPKNTDGFQFALEELDKLENYILTMIKIDEETPQNLTIPFFIDGILVKSKNSLYKEIKRMLMDCKNHFANLGTYGGNIALLIHTIGIQRTMCICQKESFVAELRLVESTMIRVRKSVIDELNGASGSIELIQFSSPKVLRLISIVSDHIKELTTPDNDAQEIDTKLRAIVFVQRRVTAKIFFNMGKVNLIVSSSVLEEGMDVPKCNLVIKFDSPDTFSSFIQSKGRARDQTATFYVLHERDQNRDINQAVFCHSLSVDKFSDMAPLWYKNKMYDGVTCTILLPLNPHYRKPTTGEIKGKYKDARNSTAFQTIKILHKIGALDDHLKPNKEPLNNMMDSKELFPNWKVEPKDLPFPRGSTKYKDTYDKHVPKVLRDCAPREGLVYMHLVTMKPAYQQPYEARRQTLYELLCQFPIFMGVGKVMVTISENYDKLTMSKEVLELARDFHMSLFNDLLSLNKAFLQHNFESGFNNYLVVPTIAVPDSSKVTINLDLLNKRPNLKVPDTPITGNETNLCLKVVTPWYRCYGTDIIAGDNKNYIVTDVCESLNPDSPFPSNQNGIRSYRQYYKDKYQLEIANDSQPLLQVKSISNRLNYLTPRPPLNIVKRKRDQVWDVDETFVPELCKLVGAGSFVSAQLWLKTTAMPSVLFRMTHLLVAEELRVCINSDTGLGVSQVPFEWEPMVVKENLVEVSKSKKVVQPKGYGPPQIKTSAPNIAQIKMPWDESREHEPIDLDKNLDKITLLEIREYDQFARKANEDTKAIVSTAITNHHCQRDRSIQVKPIALLNPHTKNGPQQHTIYAALTTTTANEGLDMERLECLGDSYLKFATSLYLFCSFQQTEGALTSVKGKIISNRNLLYCGVKRNIGNCMNPLAISVNTEWKVANLEVDEKFKQLIKESILNSDDLEHLCLSDEEKKSGKVSESTWESLLELVLDDVERDEVSKPKQVEASVYDSFLDMQCVPDKRVADCVEAVLGAYVESCGTRASAKLLSWFGILPPNIESLMSDDTALVGVRASDLSLATFEVEVNRLLTGTDSLEKQLNYKFKNRDILLQAISHASYISNRLTDSFERLEFLGDAVLGQLTDLRSALVNNITFASLAVRFGFYQHLQYESSKILTSVEKFVRYQEENNHCINGEYLLLFQEDSVKVAQSVEVPKILGDIWESLAGAVFLDSGKNLATTWNVFYPLMKTEIVRMLYESVAENSVKFQKPEKLEDSPFVMIKLILDFQNKKHNFYGVGENKTLAKTAAAKCALRYISNFQQQQQQNPQF
ncbi:hypothetical protein B566_EDAN016212 [Ephemera danica]|nr:hypothetical protein B566_EDAN016212 [Ephemera danica]